jgi:hypothetical protein
MQCATVFLVFPDMLIDALVTDKGNAIGSFSMTAA